MGAGVSLNYLGSILVRKCSRFYAFCQSDTRFTDNWTSEYSSYWCKLGCSRLFEHPTRDERKTIWETFVVTWYGQYDNNTHIALTHVWSKVQYSNARSYWAWHSLTLMRLSLWRTYGLNPDSMTLIRACGRRTQERSFVRRGRTGTLWQTLLAWH